MPDMPRVPRLWPTLLRLFLVYLLLGLLPLMFLAYVSLGAGDRTVRREVESKVRTTSSVSAVFVQQEMATLAEMVQAYAKRKGFIDTLLPPDGAPADRASVLNQLRELKAMRTGLAGAAVTDTQGVATRVLPDTGGWARDMRDTDWFAAVSRTRQPYVSSVYAPDIFDVPRAVAVAAPIESPPGRLIGVLVVAHSLDAVQELTSRVADVQGIRLSVTDQLGTVVAEPNVDRFGLVSRRADSRVSAALAGRSGFGRVEAPDGDLLSAYAPIPGVGWTVIAEVPTRTAFAGVAELRSRVFSVAGLVAIVLLSALGIQARLVRQRWVDEQTLARYAAELAVARDQALDSSRLKSRFLANMSHEIRTPMNGVLGMTSLLLSSGLNDEQRLYAENAAVSAESLLGVLDDILDLSKIEAGRLTIESVDFDVRVIAEDVAELFAPRAHAAGLSIALLVDGDVPAAVRGDPSRLRQVLSNLVGNAVKFTASGEVVIHIGVASWEDAVAVLRFDVVDTGIGIPDEQLEQVFDAFSQADASTTRRFGGTGLGLAICRQLVELMGGEIHVESIEGEGTRFWFTLPAELVAVDDKLAGALDGVRIGIAESERSSARAITEFVQGMGGEVEAVSPAVLASVLAGTAHPALDALLLSEDLIDDLGRDRISGTSAPHGVRIIVLTRLGSQSLHPAVTELALAHVTKPTRRAQLVAALRPDRAATRLADSPVPPAAHQRQPRVLVAEDNEINQRVAVAMLQRRGWAVDVAADGLEAVSLARANPYDVILMDLQMPELDGYRATQEIRRSEPPGRRTPIVAISASAMPSDRIRCLESGMDDYISKPVSWPRLDAALSRLVLAEARPADDGFDAAAVDELAEVDAELAETVTSLFLSRVPGDVRRLRKSVDAGDLDEASTIAHTLKSSALTLGAVRLAALLADAERLARTGEVPTALLDMVDAELATVCAALGERRATAT